MAAAQRQPALQSPALKRLIQDTIKSLMCPVLDLDPAVGLPPRISFGSAEEEPGKEAVRREREEERGSPSIHGLTALAALPVHLAEPLMPQRLPSRS